MKNLFKKSSKKETKVSVEKLDKTQLEKVIGGVETTVKPIATAEGPRYQS